MLNHMAMSRSLLEILAATALLCIFSLQANAQSSGSATSQNITLTDPTPRPPDLQRQYADDPVARALQQQAALAQRQLRHQEVLAATNKLVVLAQELKDEMAKNGMSASTNPDSIKAQEIERLAKHLKKEMKSQ